MPTTVTTSPAMTTTDAAGNTVTSYTTTVTIPAPAVVVPPPNTGNGTGTGNNPPAQTGITLGLMGNLNGFVPVLFSALNSPVNTLPVNAAIDAPFKKEYTTGGADHLHIDNTIPYVVVNVPASSMVKFASMTDSADSDNVPYPLDPTWPATWFEGGGKITSNPSGDRHVILLNTANNFLYEVYNPVYNATKKTWSCYACRAWDMTKEAAQIPGRNSCDAAGLSVFQGMLRYEEAANGTIKHALRFTMNSSNSQYIPPACHSAGGGDAAYMGMRMVLRANYPLAGLSAVAQNVVKALQVYGAVMCDNGSNLYFTADADPRWNTNDFQALSAITDLDFSVVDTGNPVTPPA